MFSIPNRRHGLGKPVVGLSSLAAAGGKLRRLDKGTLKGTVTFNQAAIKREKTAIVLEPASDPELAAALRHVCGAAGSKWRVVEPTQGSVPAAGEKVVRVGASFAAWLQGQRRVRNSLGPRVWTADGDRIGGL